MYVVEENHDLVYTKIKEGSLQGSCSVLIFVAATIDALCACRIFVTLLKSDFISFKLVPVSGYDDLARANEEIVQDNSDLRSIVMLDCGGMADLSEVFSLTETVQVFVFDTHRPYHLSNLFENDNIYIFDDGDIHSDEQKFAELHKSLIYLADVTNASLADDDDDDDDNDDNDGDNNDHPGATKRHVERRTHRRRLAEYYASHTYGASVSRLLYSLSTRLVKSNNDLLWLAIVGLTDQYLSHRLRHDRYIADIHDFSRDVLQFNITDDDHDHHHQHSTTHPSRKHKHHHDDPIDNHDHDHESDDLRLSNLSAYFNRHFSTDAKCRLSFPEMERLQYLMERHHSFRKRKSTNDVITVEQPYDDNDTQSDSVSLALTSKEQHELHLLRMKLLNRVQEGKLAFSEELHLVLLRHWVLYDSIMYSPYTSTLLSTHTEKGRRQLHHCLAKMGYSLKQCQQKYLMMDIQLKQQLKPRLESTLMTASSSVSLAYGSFTRQYNWKTCLSASDVVYGLQSILYYNGDIDVVKRASMDGLSKENHKNHGSHENHESKMGGVDEGEDSKERENVRKYKELSTRQFYAAYDALNDTDALLRGIQGAMGFYKRLAQQVTNILERKAVISTRSLRFATLSERNDDERRMTHPRSLMQLAYVLVDASSSKKKLPLVLAALNSETNYYTVVGWMKGNRQSVNVHGFGVVFKEAAEKTRSQTKHDQFDTCVIEVHKDDMTRFMEYLQLHAGQYGL